MRERIAGKGTTWKDLGLSFLAEVLLLLFAGILFFANVAGELFLFSSVVVALISDDIFDVFGTGIEKPWLGKQRQSVLKILWTNAVIGVSVASKLTECSVVRDVTGPLMTLVVGMVLVGFEIIFVRGKHIFDHQSSRQ